MIFMEVVIFVIFGFIALPILISRYAVNEKRQKECIKSGGHYLRFHSGHGYFPDQYSYCTECKFRLDSLT